MTARDPRSERTGDFELCVVGAGPVGLSCAMEAAESGLRVLLVDAGTERSGEHPLAGSARRRTEIVDLARHASLELTVRRGLGGTSSMWGGRCVPLEPIDFEARDYIPDGQWPIGYRDIASSYSKAAEYLDCGAAEFRSSEDDWAGLEEFEISNLERWARQPKLAARLGARVIGHPLVTAMFATELVDLAFASDGRIDALVVERDGERRTVHAESYVLALGGLESTRFLLDVQRRHPTSFGGPDGPLGRYYMGHLTGAIADIVFADPSRAADLDFRRDSDGTYTRRRFTLSEAAQRRHGVLNTSFYLDNPAFSEPEHRNATLSLVFLGLAIPPVGRRILAEGIRLRHIGTRPYRIGKHLRNVLRRPWRAATDVLDVLLHRYLSPVRKPGFILENAGGRYALHFHSEQLPNPASRLTMHGTDEVDDPAQLRVDFRYLEADVDSLLHCHELLDAELRRCGIGRLEFHGSTPEQTRALIWEQATDGFHSIGTTRMGVDAADGVVDGDCRVHGVDNLYLASSSVFRTSAEANPTFAAAALAVRLARHLAFESGLTRPQESRTEAAAS